MIGIIDYSLGNTGNLVNALKKLGYESVITKDKNVLSSCEAIILPGVGHFGYAMNIINTSGLKDMIIELSENKRLIGICLGMQLLFEHSEEGNAAGLGILKGRIARIDTDLTIPHLGWNTLTSNDQSLNGKDVYFIHSYKVSESEYTIAETDYNSNIPAIVKKENITGIQFHPEKSGETGLFILKNALEGSF
ncbi:imidazole glycerol phosphate synthase subunit HisH [Jeotgalicoccus psychrophilus]|uniref:imidazole glycerol phosphate synthase subunit HisH n=1 Tax=Jeotgalicoccus psychrophilus TaxID=157228 RepID=UPI0004186A82|nr:imidazole glycerol phosphate synthase subunit HisH [Jeotgalicoccus psychrophilus]